MPKSSMAIRAPSARSAAISAITASLASIAAVSVNSSSISDKGTSCSARVWRRRAKKSARSSCRGLTLKPSRWARPSRFQPASSIATSEVTQSPTSAIIPVRSAIGMKLSGSRRPSRGWFQRSSASAPDDFAADQAHLRLQHQLQLAALKRLGQRLFGIDLGLVLGRELVVEQAMLAAAARLGAIHGDVGGAHQRFDAGAMVGADRHADRRADVDAVAVKLERLADRQRHPARDPLDVVARGDVGEEQGELVAGEAGEQRPAGRRLR